MFSAIRINKIHLIWRFGSWCGFLSLLAAICHSFHWPSHRGFHLAAPLCPKYLRVRLLRSKGRLVYKCKVSLVGFPCSCHWYMYYIYNICVCICKCVWKYWCRAHSAFRLWLLAVWLCHPFLCAADCGSFAATATLHTFSSVCVAVVASGVYVAPLGLLLLLFNACAGGMKVNCAAAAECKCIHVYFGLWHWPNAGRHTHAHIRIGVCKCARKLLPVSFVCCIFNFSRGFHVVL